MTNTHESLRTKKRRAALLGAKPMLERCDSSQREETELALTSHESLQTSHERKTTQQYRAVIRQRYFFTRSHTGIFFSNWCGSGTLGDIF
jgi:hypothetical protein